MGYGHPVAGDAYTRWLKARRRASDASGFTLVELMVVLFVMAVIIGIAIPTFLGSQNLAYDRQTQSDLYNAMISGQSIYGNTATYPKTTKFEAALTKSEPAYSYTTNNSSGPNQISVGIQADPVAAYAALSKTHTCWMVVDNLNTVPVHDGSDPTAFPPGVHWAGIANATNYCAASGVWSGFSGHSIPLRDIAANTSAVHVVTFANAGTTNVTLPTKSQSIWSTTGHTTPTTTVTSLGTGTTTTTTSTTPTTTTTTTGPATASKTGTTSATPGTLTLLANQGGTGCTHPDLRVSGNGEVSVHNALVDVSAQACSILAEGNGGVSAGHLFTGDRTWQDAFHHNGNGHIDGSESYGRGGYEGPENMDAPEHEGKCTKTGQTTECTPGTYKTQLSLSGNGQVVFQSGKYDFRDGIHVSGNISICSGEGASCLPAGSDPGVLFYIGGGTMTLSGNAGVSLHPLQTGNVAPNMLIFQSHGDCNEATIEGNGTATTYGGEIYVPMNDCSPAHTSYALRVSGNGNLSVQHLDVCSLDMEGNGKLTVG